MRKASTIILIVILLVSVIMGGCQNGASTTASTAASSASESTSSGSGQTTASGEGDTYYMVTFLSGAEYWKGCIKGFEEAGKNFGVKVVYAGDPQYDVNNQITVFEQVLAKKPKGIAVCAINPEAFVPVINKAIEAGIPVVTFASDSPDSKRLSFICADNRKEGAIGADTLAAAIGGAGEVGIIQRPGQMNLDLRVEGFETRIAEKYPDIKIVARGMGEGNEQTSATATASMLQANPNIKAIYTIAGIEAIGAAAAVKETGKDIKIFCFDGDASILDLIKEGSIYATGAANTYAQGYWSMVMLHTAANGLCNPVSDWKIAGRSPLPLYVDSGTDVVTKDNADSFYIK